MGKALYRVHRSKSFDDVVGQEHITNTLKQAIKKDAISHAYLFTGPRGTGKTSVARILAHAINELDYDEEAQHLDIIEIDAASNRRIDEIRELRDKVHVAPTSARYKVYIIDEVHMLTREAFNALLKTLEEPPEHAVFILATTELHKVPDTIVSRTQRYSFSPIAHDAVVAHLGTISQKEGLDITAEALEALARYGNGSFRDSISMLDQLSGMKRSSYDITDVQLLLGLPKDAVIDDLKHAVANADIAGIFAGVQALRQQGTDPNRAAQALSSSLREDILNGKADQLLQPTALQLLKQLLPLTNAATDYTALEVAILSALSPEQLSGSTAKSPAPAPKKPPKTAEPASSEKKPDPGPLQKPLQAEEPALPDEVPTEDESDESSEHVVIEDFDKSWNQLLGDVKVKHNTLYGVLRMAEASQTDDGVRLVFGFDFHKKRVDAPAHKQVFNQYLKKHFGDAQCDIMVEKKSGTQPAPVAAVPVTAPAEQTANEPGPTDSNQISSVSNIFGGAELLE